MEQHNEILQKIKCIISNNRDNKKVENLRKWILLDLQSTVDIFCCCCSLYVLFSISFHYVVPIDVITVFIYWFNSILGLVKINFSLCGHHCEIIFHFFLTSVVVPVSVLKTEMLIFKVVLYITAVVTFIVVIVYVSLLMCIMMMLCIACLLSISVVVFV